MEKKILNRNISIEDFTERLENLLNFDNEIETAEEKKKKGVELQKKVPLNSHSEWNPPKRRLNPVNLLKKQGESRVQALLPIRYERMSESAFKFYRGAALIMASDLSHTPSTKIPVQVCGDAHVSNFGLFNSPEGRTVFDINDFDETAIGPWEWDIKRLATSIEICGRDRDMDKKVRKQAVKACAKSYREAMLKFSKMKNRDVWVAHVDVDDLYKELQKTNNKGTKKIGKTIAKAKRKDSSRAVEKLTETVDGKLRIKNEPPLIISLSQFDEGESSARLCEIILDALYEYRSTVSNQIRRYLDVYTGIDAAHKVVGVGSVGTRAFIVLLQGVDTNDYLILQIKQAEESVIERFCGKSEFENHGQRVVEGQKSIQSTSDMFLGWCQLLDENNEYTDYYVRELWNGKGAPNLDKINKKGLVYLSEACGATLAHAHARTGDRYKIAGYLGKEDTFDKAIWKFAQKYADQNEEDYAKFMDAYNNKKLY